MDRKSSWWKTGRAAAIAVVLALLPAHPATAQQAARDLFGAVDTPSPGDAAPIGSYAKGCLAGGVQLAPDGPGWQAMRPSRNRAWGTPALVGYIEWLAAAAQKDGWPGLLVGDLGQPRGGPMKSGHASHQIGLDADFWLLPMPDHTLSAKERESLSATSVLIPKTRTVEPRRFGIAEARLIARAALNPEVARIFVAPGIKAVMCEMTWQDRGFLNKVRPWYGHDDHFHVRLSCPDENDATCTDQAPPPKGDGCGDELAYWLSDEPYKPSNEPPAKPLTLADLPKGCAGVLGGR